MKPLLWLLLVWSILGGTIVYTLEYWTGGPSGVSVAPIVDGPAYLAQQRHHHHPIERSLHKPEQNQRLLVIFGGLGIASILFFVWEAVAAFRFNRIRYPQLKNQWSLCFMCRDCGALFPAPDAETIVLT